MTSSLVPFYFLAAALSCLQISYLFNGVPFLDAGVFLLVPAFLLFFAGLFKGWRMEPKDTSIGLALLVAAAGFALFHKYQFHVGSVDDNYHTAKIISFSVQNSFGSKFSIPGILDNERYYLVDFIECLWGIAWRFLRWDYIIVIVQILPVFVVWERLVRFFRRRGICGLAGLLSTAILFSMQVIWSQACSTYIDSVAGMVAAIALLSAADLLDYPEERNFQHILPAFYTAMLCLIAKPSVLPVGVFTTGVCLWSMFRLSRKEAFLVLLSVLPSLAFFIKHIWHVWQMQGTPFFPWFGKVSYSTGTMFNGRLYYYYEIDKMFLWLHSHLDFKPLYVFASWLLDYRLGYVTPDPWNVGNGLLWTYIVVPVLVAAAGVNMFRLVRARRVPQGIPMLFFLAVIYYVFDMSIGSRFMLGVHVYIMAWAFAWMISRIKDRGWSLPEGVMVFIAMGALTAAFLSFSQAIKGHGLQRNIVSVLEAQAQVYPKVTLANGYQKEYCSWLVAQKKVDHPSRKTVRAYYKCEMGYYQPMPPF